MKAECVEVDLFDGDVFTPIQDAVVGCESPVTAFPAGRRTGKTFSCARKVMTWMHQWMQQEFDALERGERDRWAGEGLKRTAASEIDPDVLILIGAPREDQLQQIKSYMLQLYQRNGKAFRHPLFVDWLEDHARRLWVWHDGISGRFDFIPLISQKGAVGRGLRGAWIDEAGYVPNDVFLALKPALWEHAGRILASGTPSLEQGHWFTKLCVSGLPPGHEREDAEISEPDDRVTTFIADTIHHAAVPAARVEAERDAKFWGPAWAALWVYADWRHRGLNVFECWDEAVHVRSLRLDGERSRSIREELTTPIRIVHPWGWLGDTPLPRPPDRVVGMVDWSGGTAPGAAVAALVWNKTPLSKDDPRSLVVAVEDYEGHEAYVKGGGEQGRGWGWWDILGDMTTRRGVSRWLGDPHNPHLLKVARKAGIKIEEGASQDKPGRLALLGALMHHDKEAGILPAFYVAPTCENLRREIGKYRWARKRTGEVTDKPIQHGDHTIDCCAMLAAEVYVGTPGSIRIGSQTFRA